MELSALEIKRVVYDFILDNNLTSSQLDIINRLEVTLMDMIDYKETLYVKEMARFNTRDDYEKSVKKVIKIHVKEG